LDDNWQSMFVVPTYVVEQNPGVTSVEDIPDYKDLFVTADSGGKARLVTCVIGWNCEVVNQSKLGAYGFEDDIELVPPGSAAALFADLEGAYAKGDNWLGYMWGPTQTAAELNLTILEEAACVGADGPETGCAYPTALVRITVHPTLISRAPEVVEMLRLWDFTTASQVAAEGWMAENEASFDEAAIWFLENDDVWTQWVTDVAASEVKASLE